MFAIFCGRIASLCISQHMVTSTNISILVERRPRGRRNVYDTYDVGMYLVDSYTGRARGMGPVYTYAHPLPKIP